MTRKYGPLRGPTFSSCGGLRPLDEAFFALRATKKLIKTFSSNLSKFERNPKKMKKSKKNPKNFQKLNKSRKLNKKKSTKNLK